MPRSTPQYYLPGQGDILSPGAAANGALSQFDRFVAACGEYAAEFLYAIQRGVAPSATHADLLVESLSRQGLATTQGTTGLRGLQIGLAQEGVQSTVIDNWRQAIASFGATKRPTILLFQNAQALPGDESGVFGHFGTVEGYSPSTGKFVVADSDNQAAKSGRLNLYSFADLVRAHPVGALVPTMDPAGSGPTTPTTPPGPPAINAAQTILNASGGVGGFGGLGQGIGQGIASGLAGAGTSALHAVGVNSTRDLLFRVVLITAGVLIVLVAIVAILLPRAEQGAQQAAQVAPLAALA